MAKQAKIRYTCSNCGDSFSRWAGKCPSCSSWNTLQEEEIPRVPFAAGKGTASGAWSGRASGEDRPLLTLADVDPDSHQRRSTGMKELDLVLGGGLVPGSFILIGGEPGVGKSTLVLEIARRFQGKLYYYSGEESPGQIRMRAERMKLTAPELYISRETDLESICSRILKERPGLVVIDSIQTVYRAESGSSPGSVGQLREAAMAVMESCKSAMVPVIVTGHITKDGAIAGPRLLEHMVDAVLYFESDRLNHYRILRAVKNRFGPVGELALFEMHQEGLREVAGFSPDLPGVNRAAGRVHSVILEGSRAMGVEVQALVTRASYGPARRTADGLEARRLILIAAVMEKFMKMSLGDHDIFANLAGGLSSDDPGLDLALCAAILSSYREIPPPGSSAFVGEVGLSGEVRSVGRIGRRIKELTNLGFRKIFIPEASLAEVEGSGSGIVPVSNVAALPSLFSDDGGPF